MAVIWSDRAATNLNEIFDFLAFDNPDAAARVARALIAASRSLEAFPNRGRPGPRGTRELVNVRPYILRYRVEGSDVLILRIRHAAQLQDEPGQP